MNQVYFRFYAELNDFLPTERRNFGFVHTLDKNPSVKDSIEALGVPHTEIDLILVNGESVDFAYLLQDGSRISVYPVFEAIDITPLLRVRPQPLREICFILDVHLGKLANYLRLFGFDTWYRNDYEDAELAQISSSEKRILLTRDMGLLKRSLVTYGYFLRETNPKRQLREILRRFDLFRLISPFRRCINCNGSVHSVDKADIREQVQADTLQYYERFSRCDDCGKIYWQGSHYKKMQAFVEEVME
ncbi:twitching motility protein PilT [Candidatus Thiomargarita nelsonii]|uniref:Twitching motility protein PilT n=1 Tax=Candidatus Thiomargarita nelsonii TaxID=1003181 RepID=A0A0A6PC71_9GAMM|nr:twitching motility protein PilT [Candidatus Thiomargarita nelsonii]